MFKFLNKNKAKIGDNSNGNTINQGNTYINVSPLEYINVLSQQKQYEAIQVFVQSNMDIVAKSHPFFPDFSADFDSKLNRLVSTPQTEEAFEKYPKRVNGILHINYEEFPYMKKEENPFSYAYRTQTTLKLLTTDVKEYLGEFEDPFPTVKEGEHVYTIIKPPEFPKASMVRVCSGNISIPVLVRRIPCFEYDEVHIASVEENDIGFNLLIKINDDKKLSNFTIDKTNECSLVAHLERERLIEQIRQTKQLSVMFQDKELLHTTISEADLNQPFFTQANDFCVFLEKLIAISNHFDCQFDKIKDINIYEANWVTIINASINNEWTQQNNLKFEKNYSEYKSLEHLLSNHPDGVINDLLAEGEGFEVMLFGIRFTGNISIVYQNVKINNIDSVKKHIKKKKSNILFTLKPVDGNESFTKYYRFENITAERLKDK